MQVTATEAKNRFGYFCTQAKIEPIVIEKDGRPDSVIVSYEEFKSLKAAVSHKMQAQKKKAFQEKYKDWIQEQNTHFDQHGLWSDGLVSWLEPA